MEVALIFLDQQTQIEYFLCNQYYFIWIHLFVSMKIVLKANKREQGDVAIGSSGIFKKIDLKFG